LVNIIGIVPDLDPLLWSGIQISLEWLKPMQTDVFTNTTPTEEHNVKLLWEKAVEKILLIRLLLDNLFPKLLTPNGPRKKLIGAVLLLDLTVNVVVLEQIVVIGLKFFGIILPELDVERHNAELKIPLLALWPGISLFVIMLTLETGTMNLLFPVVALSQFAQLLNLSPNQLPNQFVQLLNQSPNQLLVQ
jgi:hypothetical protein